ncbi:Oxidase FUB9 [Lasiodiplodia hormozganensis]|uniref:Oxidase FUB9 n=1 Tax=Lasiodiplodia hormozganensis TaxID=869390 RepID=A0AA39XVC1_9PEZI|nr:Oxidase FUB9 [Lasiodiplodia hormozganensis]
MDMITLHDNEAAFTRYKIRPRILTDVSAVDTSTTIFGQRVAFPFGFAPAASHKLAHPDGEAATARAAARVGVCMGLSAYATTGLEEVAAAAADELGKGGREAQNGVQKVQEGWQGPPLAMQLTMFRDRGVSARILKRAEGEYGRRGEGDAGYKAVFLTVDCPVLGMRLNEYRNNFAMPDDMTFPNLTENPSEPISLADGDAKLSYVYTADDVILAIRHGVDGVIVSNHGGRQLDGVPATLDALRECAAAGAGRIQIGIDGGIRRGTDIFKALALGATHCFAGRVPIWGLAHDGQEGVELALNILMAEFKMTMGLAG